MFPAVALAINGVIFGIIGPRKGGLEASAIEVGSGAQNVTVGDDSVWVSGVGDVAVSEIDVETEEVVGEPIPGELPGEIAVVNGNVWVGSNSGNTLIRIDPTTHEVLQEEQLGQTPQHLADGGDLLWVSVLEGPIESGGFVAALDPSTGEIQDRIGTHHEFPAGIEADDENVWVTDVRDDVLVQISATEREFVREIEVGSSPTAVAVGAGSVWVSHFGDGTLYRIDPESGEVTLREVLVLGGGLTDVAFGGGSVWVTSQTEDVLYEFNPETEEVERRLQVGDSPQSVDVGFGSLWIANQEDGTVTRLKL